MNILNIEVSSAALLHTMLCMILMNYTDRLGLYCSCETLPYGGGATHSKSMLGVGSGIPFRR